MSQQDGLNTLSPPRRHVTYRGRVLEVGPLRLEQLGPFITAARPLIGRAAVIMGLVDVASPVELGAQLLDLMEQDAAAFVKAAAVVTGEDEEWLAGAELADVEALATVIVELNVDFFAQRLPGLFRKASAAMPSGTKETGQTSSTTSSPAATTAETS